MRRFAASLVVILLLVNLGQTSASQAEYTDGHIGDLRPTISSKREALAWLERHSVTLTEFIAMTGRQPKVDRTGHRWQFRDGAILTNCIQLPNGDLVISCWGSVE